MKNLTITVPCYNSEDYLERCLNSLVIEEASIEIIVVDDGSTDRTAEIADAYKEKFPDMITVVHKENGGHGSAVNKGMELASGQYFKVVDSDDWLEEGAYKKLLTCIKSLLYADAAGERSLPDLLICNYTYNHLETGETKTISYKNVFPVETEFSWEDIKHFKPSQYLVMHSLVYRTEILKKSGVRLPEHTFYVDNIFAYYPLPYVKSLFYIDIDLYQYYLGREDQSVNEKVMISRIEQQIKVTQIVAKSVNLKKVKEQSPKLAAYMYRNISIMMAISSIHLLLAGDSSSCKRHQKLWMDMKRYDAGLYYRLRYTKLSGLTNLPGYFGKKLTIDGYRLAKRIYKFQ